MSEILNAAAVDAAARHSYEYEGNRKGCTYVGWSNEPEDVRDEWRTSVREAIEAYELNKPASPEALNAEEGEPVAWRWRASARHGAYYDGWPWKYSDGKPLLPFDLPPDHFEVEPLYAHHKPSPATGLVEALESARTDIEHRIRDLHREDYEPRDIDIIVEHSPILRRIDAALSSFKTGDGDREIERLRGTLEYIATQARAAHPGALKVIAMNADAALGRGRVTHIIDENGNTGWVIP